MIYCTGRNTSLSGFSISKDVNEILSEHIPYLEGNTKKIIKGLCKQYRIISISQEEDIYCDDYRGNRRILQAMPVVIKYKNWETNDPRFEPFEWKFSIFELNYNLL